MLDVVCDLVDHPIDLSTAEVHFIIFMHISTNNLTVTKKHRIVYLISFCICILILADANYSPVNGKTNVVLKFECLEARYGRYHRNNTRNYITVKDHTYDISLRHCLPIDEGDTIVVYRSALTHALAFIEIDDADGQYTVDVSFVNGRIGKFLIWIVLFMILVFFIFHNKLGNETGKRNMTYFLLLCSIALLLQHILNIW